MLDTTTQNLWSHVSGLRPEIRRNITIRAHNFRGNRWYLLHDTNAGRFLRINSTAYQLVGRFNGEHTLEQIVDLCQNAEGICTKPEKIDVLEVLAQLHEFEGLDGGLPSSAQDVLRRYKRARKQDLTQRWGNPLSLRFSLINPEPLLNALQPLARSMGSTFGLTLIAATVMAAMMVVLFNLSELSAAVVNMSFGSSDIMLLALLYPVVKALHELGHGLAVKRWGGAVHEAGIFLLVFFPVPYVDGSAAWAFREKHRRAIVSGAGIMVELLLAAAAVLVWAITEPSLINDIALNILLIAGLSTLLYNGNPLLRFDGYYVLEDLVEIPNLATRSTQYYFYLLQRYGFGITESVTPVQAHGERKWFVVYGFLSPMYRIFVLLAIALFLMQKYPVVGIILAVWAIFIQLLQPLWRSIHYLALNPLIKKNRVRSTLAVASPLLIVAVLMSIPVPMVTRSQGIVWVGDDAQITAKTEGVVSRVFVGSGDFVEAGEGILKLTNPELETLHAKLESRLAELWIRQAIEQSKSRVLGQTATAELNLVRSQLDNIQKKISGLTVTSSTSGRVIFNDPHALNGKFYKEGDSVAFVSKENTTSVRMVVDQSSMGIVRSGVLGAEVMLANRIGTVLNASISHETPAAVSKLPSAILGIAGGGPIRTDPTDLSGLTAASEIFQLDLELAEIADASSWGSRAFVKLIHDDESLWHQWSRRVRQLILSRLSV